jgi:ribulose-5-phosphate 4-epimerase/fuculose-1-phosphate aldolase
MKDKVSPEEWETRVELAAFYRLVAKHDMDDLVGTHISARVPGEPNNFLLNPYGLLFEEITASSLVKCDMDGNILHDTPYGLNAAGYTIHSAVQSGRPDVVCAAHTHTVPGMALSALEHGLRPLHQKAARFYGNIAYHDYEGVATNLDERERLQRDIKDKNALMLRNHGLLVATGSVRSAWALLYNFEKCCAAQLMIEATGAEVIEPSLELMESNAKVFNKMLHGQNGGTKADGWDSALRILAREDDSFMH